MNTGDQVLVRMAELLASWEEARDRRVIFLSCYKMMTENILKAIHGGDFEDPPWVASLMENFAGYYFFALDKFEKGLPDSPEVWGITFEAAQNPHTHVLQNLVLGVNAHINYDLVFALSDLLSGEWEQLSPEQRKMRYRDHCRVNEVISHTIDEVQDQVIARFEPLFAVADKLLGPLDEWMTAMLISEWREEVWRHATGLLEPADQSEREEVIQRVHQLSLARARDILGKGSLRALTEFI